MPHDVSKLFLGIFVFIIMFSVGITGTIQKSRIVNNHGFVELDTNDVTEYEFLADSSTNYDSYHYYYVGSNTNKDFDVTVNGDVVTISESGTTISKFEIIRTNVLTGNEVNNTFRYNEYYPYENMKNIGSMKPRDGAYNFTITIIEGSLSDYTVGFCHADYLDAKTDLIYYIITLVASIVIGIYTIYSYIKSRRGTQYVKGHYDLKAAFERKNLRTYGRKKPSKDADPFGDEDPFQGFEQ